MENFEYTAMNIECDDSTSMKIQSEECTSMNSMYETLLSKFGETEREICVFYAHVFNFLFENSGRYFNPLEASLRTIRSKKLDRSKTIPFHQEYTRLAYIFAYGAIHSVIMYDRFSKIFKLNENMLKKMTTTKTIRFCFLGGGPALGAAAMSKLFNDIATTFSNAESEKLELYVTIVDKFPEWEEDAHSIISAAQRNFCDATKVQIYFRFVEADLTTEFSEDLTKIIKKAHVVTMFKFLSDLNKDSYSEEKEIPDMIQMILTSMSFNACLFYLDSSGGSLFSTVDRLIDEHESTLRIYGPYTHSRHSLSKDSIDKLKDILGNVSFFFRCTTQCTISCSAWLKERKTLKVDGLYCNDVVQPVEVLEYHEKLHWKKNKNKISTKWLDNLV